MENEQNNGTKKKKPMIILLLMIVVVLLVILLYEGFSRYATRINGESDGDVAKWSFDVSSTDATSNATSEDGSKNFGTINLGKK